MAQTVYIMRHAETLFNLQSKTQGWCDSPLTARGIEQARLTGLELARRGLTFDHAYSSTSERCNDTLEIATEAAFGEPMPYERRKGLKEINFGAFEGKDQCLELHDEGFGEFYVKFGGESHSAATERFENDLRAILSRPNHQSVLVCSHGGISINFYMKWSSYAKVPPTIFSNCMIYVYKFEDDIFSCVDMFVADLSSLEQPGMPQQVKVIDQNKRGPL